MNFIKICLISILTLATLVACSEDKDKDKGGEGLNNVLNLTLGKKVIDDNKVKSTNLLITDKEGVPVSGATVLFGEDIDHPFKDNQLITDNNGEVALPKNWTAPLPITIEAPGFIRITYTRVEPVAQTLQMDKVEAKNFIEVSGVTTDYGRLRSDGFIDFSLIIPAFTQRSMINFDLSSVISPVNDTLSVAGKNFELPSNISLPRQTESYIFPITFEKPVYRAFIRNPGFYKLFATHGRFPFKKVIDDFRSGKSVFEVINKFDFNGGGQKDLQINKNMNNQNFHRGKSLWIRKHIADVLAEFAIKGEEKKFLKILLDRDVRLHPYALKALRRITGEKLAMDKGLNEKRTAWLQYFKNKKFD